MMKPISLVLAATLGVLASNALSVDADYSDIPDTLALSAPADSKKSSKESPVLQPRHVARVVTVPALHWAAIAGDLAEVRSLLDDGANVTATETLWGGERALHYGAIGGHPVVVRELLEAGASIEVKDHAGETAVREALRGDDPSYRALQTLLVAGADPEARSNDGSTALHEAVRLPSEHGSTAVLLLRMFGADPNSREEESQRVPMHYAVLQPYERFSGGALISTTYDPSARSADLNARDSNGWTPLHWLASPPLFSAQDLRVALWLLLQGADPDAIDEEGRTALDLAETSGADELADLLRRAMN